METNKKYLNPYLAGVILGILILASFMLTREGLGASGAFKRTAAKIEQVVVPGHINKPETYFNKYVKGGENPMKDRLVFMILGVFAGGFISGAINKRLKFKLQHSPKITRKTRIFAALIGGILFGIGASFGRGCTSGAGLDGMAVLATSGFVAVAAIFGSGYIFAYFFRKLWL